MNKQASKQGKTMTKKQITKQANKHKDKQTKNQNLPLYTATTIVYSLICCIVDLINSDSVSIMVSTEINHLNI